MIKFRAATHEGLQSLVKKNELLFDFKKLKINNGITCEPTSFCLFETFPMLCKRNSSNFSRPVIDAFAILSYSPKQ
jgi:hypothetical protein